MTSHWDITSQSEDFSDLCASFVSQISTYLKGLREDWFCQMCLTLLNKDITCYLLTFHTNKEIKLRPVHRLLKKGVQNLRYFRKGVKI